MQKRIYTTLILAAAATPAMADLQVNSDLGTLAKGAVTIADTTVGRANNASVYSTYSNTTTLAWDRGEYVYQFTLDRPSYLFLTDTAEPDTGTVTPAPNHDYFLLNTLTTFTTDNTTAYYAGSGKPEATSLAHVTESMGATTSGSSANIGAFRNAATNPYALYQAGTYYLSVDARGGTGANTQNAGNFYANLNVAYYDDTPPASTAATIDATGSISGTYNAGETLFFAFDYTGGDFSVTTEGNDVQGGDSFLALYDSHGSLISFNDDTPIPGGPFSYGWSTINVVDGQLADGTYYLGFTEYKGEANPGFNLRVHPDHVGASGTFVINGLSVAAVPEPASFGLVAMGASMLAFRRRRRVV